jgi:uncharacterized protein (DUF1697 family)
MPGYVAFLRGVTPMNAKMADLRTAYEEAGFTDVRTVLSSGNVVFNSRERSVAALARKAEAATVKSMGRPFYTIVRPLSTLQGLVNSDPFSIFELSPGSKKVVTFLGSPTSAIPALPITRDGVSILASTGHEVLTAYVPNPRGPVFMTMIEKTLGNKVTTRTWETVRKCATCTIPKADLVQSTMKAVLYSQRGT